MNVPNSWLDEIEDVETKKSMEKKTAQDTTLNANEGTIDEFRDILNIRKKYMNLLGSGNGAAGATSGSNELSSS